MLPAIRLGIRDKKNIDRKNIKIFLLKSIFNEFNFIYLNENNIIIKIFISNKITIRR